MTLYLKLLMPTADAVQASQSNLSSQESYSSTCTHGQPGDLGVLTSYIKKIEKYFQKFRKCFPEFAWFLLGRVFEIGLQIFWVIDFRILNILQKFLKMTIITPKEDTWVSPKNSWTFLQKI